MGSATIMNWDRTLAYTPEAIHEPAGEEEVLGLVRRAAESGSQIKPLGSALSWSDVLDVRREAIRFPRMDRILEVDRDARTVRVQAGAPLHAINDTLWKKGLSFDNFGSITTQTAAGYIGTGSHGTGRRTPILSDYILSMRLVDGRGAVHALDAEHEPELFAAAKVNLGALGVVTEITFRCVEGFRLEERLELVEFDRLLADLDRWVQGNDYLKLWWLPYTSKVQVYAFNRTDRLGRSYGLTELMDQVGISSVGFSVLLALTRTIPPLTRTINRVVQGVHFHPHTRFDRSDRIIKYAGIIPRHHETEYAIDQSRAAEAIERTRQIVERASYTVNFPMEVRFTRGDDIPMSPAHGRDSCWIGAYIASLEWSKGYFRDFEELIKDYSGRPHWGKTFSRTAGELRALYPEYDAFATLRRTCDPSGIFRNSFVDRVFPASEAS